MNAPLLVHAESSRSWGGQEMRVLLELTAMRDCGFRVALIACAHSPLAERAQTAGLPVYALPSFTRLNPTLWLRLIRILRQIRPAVLNVHSSRDAWSAAPLARLLGVPLVIRTRHTAIPVSSLVSYRFPHEILACSAAIAAQLARQGLDPAHISVAPTGNDEARFRFSAERRASLRQRYGLADSEILIGNVGFLRIYKGQAFVLATLAQLPPHFRAMLVGDGDQRDKLERTARQQGVAERVIFAGHQERPEDFYSAFDVFFFSSWTAEGVSQALVQALLNGLPVLACDLESTAETLSGIKPCRLVAYGDVESARQALIELATLPLRDEQSNCEQIDAVASRYGLPAMMRTVTALYARYGIVAPERVEG